MPKNTNKPIELATEKFLFRDYLEFAKVSERRVFSAMQVMAHIIVSWPFDSDPAEPDAVLELDFPDAVSFVLAASKLFSTIFQETGDTTVTLDLRRWKARRFEAFQDAQEAGNIEEMVVMAWELVTDPPVANPLEANMEQIGSVFRALNNSVTESLSEGN